MDITQGSQSAIINWQGFDIGSQAQVNFAQPNASAVALNRVVGPNISRIEGQLSANGQVFLVNPNGILFGGGARVNAGAFVASTLNIRDADFLAGNYSFSGTGGAIENQGTITAAPGGYVAFIAPKITNAGTISAPQGTVAMGAGERVTPQLRRRPPGRPQRRRRHARHADRRTARPSAPKAAPSCSPLPGPRP